MLQKKKKRKLWFRLFQYGQSVAEGKSLVSWLFYPLSAAWGLVAAVKNWLYDGGVFCSKQVEVPVVSIGNIVAGGTGKTPLVQLLAETFSARKVAILSRGSSLQGSLADEPKLLAQRCPLAKVYVGKDRRLSAICAVEEGAELIFLDDGLQHRKLFRDLDLVLVSAKDPFHNGKYLPCGYLRDQPKRLKKADAIFVNPIESEGELKAWREKFLLDRPLIGVSLKSSRLVPDVRVRGVRVAMFCAIAHPSRFKEWVLSQGAFLVAEWILADHEMADSDLLQEFSLYAQGLGAEMLLCTEKDFVKISSLQEVSLPIVYPEMELKITAGLENWQNIVDKIGEKIDNCRTYGKRSKNFIAEARREHC